MVGAILIQSRGLEEGCTKCKLHSSRSNLSVQAGTSLKVFGKLVAGRFRFMTCSPVG